MECSDPNPENADPPPDSDALSRDGVTRILKEWHAGDQAALSRLMPFVYEELRRLARGYMASERSTHTLQATALVHEAFLKLAGGAGVDWNDRVHFYATAARVMRRILVDHARAHLAARRGGGVRPVAIDKTVPDEERTPDLVQLDDALSSLAEVDARKSRIIELRFFGGLSIEETAELLDSTPNRIWQESQLAKAWLFAEIEKENGSAG